MRIEVGTEKSSFVLRTLRGSSSGFADQAFGSWFTDRCRAGSTCQRAAELALNTKP